MSTGDQPENRKFGEILAEAREEKGLTAGDVAQSLKLPVDKIEAIESSDISILPVSAFTSGYLRAYAKLVGVSEEEVVQSYNRESGDTSEPSVPGAVSDLPQQATSEHLGMKVVSFALVSLVIILFVMWLQDKQENNEVPVADAPQQSSPLVDALPETIRQEEEKSELNDQIAVTDDGETNVSIAAADEQESSVVEPKDTSSNQDQAPEAEPADTGSSATTVDDTNAEEQRVISPVAPQGGDSLVITAQGDCWADIEDSNGHLLYRSLLREGERAELKGQAPFKLFLGDASVVKVEINTIEYSLDDHIRDNKTARFELSEVKARKRLQDNDQADVTTGGSQMQNPDSE